MAKSRILSFIIVIFAAAFIIYVVIDGLTSDIANETDTSNGESIGETNKEGSHPSAAKDEVGIQNGMFAPDFTLPLWDGEQEASLSDYKGQIVVLNLWASWCPPCRREMPDLIRFHEDYKDKGVQVLGMNLATLERNETGAAQFIEEYQVSFPTFVDQPIDVSNQRGIVATLYNVQSIPQTYVLDEEGKIFMAARGEIKYEMLEELVKQLLNQ